MLTIGDSSQSFQWPVHYVTANKEHGYFKIELMDIRQIEKKKLAYWLSGLP